jgi:hypothetical protein
MLCVQKQPTTTFNSGLAHKKFALIQQSAALKKKFFQNHRN